MTHSANSFERFGENGWLARYKTGGDTVETALLANAAAALLRDGTGVVDCVAGVDSLVLRFDPAHLSARAARLALEQAIRNAKTITPKAPKKIAVPVCYGGACGPDLDILCADLSLSKDQLIEIHSAQTYRVLTVGFAPGFAYLGPLPPALHCSRLDTPRARVPAGSVGVAGEMTGVYPLASPGGWRLIGRTPMRLFNPAAADPFLFAPGDEIKFTPTDETTFARMESGAP